MKTIVKVIVAALVAAVVTVAVDALDVFSYHYSFVAVYFGVAIAISLALGAFDMGAIKRDMKHTSIKDAARYGQAAVFVGTACLYMGTPQQCEDVCDDMWHYGQQAEVRALDGDMEFEIL